MIRLKEVTKEVRERNPPPRCDSLDGELSVVVNISEPPASLLDAVAVEEGIEVFAPLLMYHLRHIFIFGVGECRQPFHREVG